MSGFHFVIVVLHIEWQIVFTDNDFPEPCSNILYTLLFFIAVLLVFSLAFYMQRVLQILGGEIRKFIATVYWEALSFNCWTICPLPVFSQSGEQLNLL